MPERPIDPGQDLESRLRSLGPLIAYPETPDVAASMNLSIRKREAPRRLRSWQSGLFAAAAAVVVLGLVLGFSASTRDAVGRWVEIPGIRVSDDRDAHNDPPGIDVRASLGEPTTLTEAVAGVSFTVLLPDLALIGDPDEVYGSTDSNGGWVTLVYLADDSLPGVAESDIGLLITQIPSQPDDVWVDKRFGSTTRMLVVDVDGTEGLWIEGTHNLSFTIGDADATARTAGNVLAWHVNGITFRIESNLSLERVLEIARSLRPVNSSGT